MADSLGSSSLNGKEAERGRDISGGNSGCDEREGRFKKDLTLSTLGAYG